MPDYNNGKIYIIYPICEYDEGDIYYGSTTQILSKRMSVHRHQKFIKSLADKYGLENLKIELVCECKCETREQLNKEEGKYIRENKCINKNVAGRKTKEWKEENKNKVSEYHKKYREENKEKNLEWREENKDKLREKRIHYLEENKDRIREYAKQWYLKKKAQ